MTVQRQNFMLKATYEVLRQKIVGITDKLTVEMPKKLREAYETGGYWHDNALWETALREQEMLNRDLLKLTEPLKDIMFIEDAYPLLDEDKVTIGKTVQLLDVNTGEMFEYSIVGPLDVIYNPKAKEAKFISCEAPFIQPLLNRTQGEKIEVRLPGGTRTLTIQRIKPLSIWDQ